MQRFATNIIPLPTQLLSLAVWLRKSKRLWPVALAGWQLEWIVIVEFGTLVGIHDDRTVAAVWIWRGFAGLECRSSQ